MNNRTKIQNIIQENPGIHTNEIIRKTNLKNGVCCYHLSKLEKEGKIRSEKFSRYKRYYAPNIGIEEFPVIRNMKKPTKRNIILTSLVNPELSFNELIVKIQKSPATTSWNLSELVDEGILERCKKDGKLSFRIKDKKLFSKVFSKEFSKLFSDNRYEHAEDIFLTL